MDQLRTLRFREGKTSGLGQRGSRGPYLLLHGNSSCKEVYRPLFNLLHTLDIETVAIDLPGHGASADAEDPETGYTLPGYADTVCAVIDELGWTTAGLVGWSLGGHIALECLARERPQCAWSSALLIGSPPGRPSAEAFIAAFTNEPTTMLAGKSVFTTDDASMYTSKMLDSPDGVPPDLLEAALRTDGRARSTLIASVMAGVGADHEALLRTSNVRIAVVIGRLDPFINQHYVSAIPAENLWKKTVHRGTEWGHAPHWRFDPEFEALALSFFSES